MARLGATLGRMSIGRTLTLGFSVTVTTTVIICLTVIWFNWLIESSQEESKIVQTKTLDTIMFSRKMEKWINSLDQTTATINHGISLLYQKQLRNEEDVTVFKTGYDPVAELINNILHTELIEVYPESHRGFNQLFKVHQTTLATQKKVSETWQQAHTGLPEMLHEVRRTMIYWTLKVANMLFVQSSIDELLFESPEETPVLELQNKPLFIQHSRTMPSLSVSINKIRPLNLKLWRTANDLDMHIMLSEWEKARKLYRDVFPPSIKSIGVYLDDVIQQEEEILATQKEARKILNNELIPMLKQEIKQIEKIKSGMEKLLKHQQQLAAQQSEDLKSSRDQIESTLNRIKWIIIILTLASAAFSIGFVNWITRRILHPIKDLATRTEAISKGDLRQNGDEINRTDEIGKLVSSVNDMSQSLQELVTQFSVTMKDVAGDARKISVASKETAHGMNEQTQYIDDIRKQTDLISSSTAELEKYVEIVTEQSRNAEQTAKESFKTVNEALERMDSVHEIFSETTDGIMQLNNAVEQITQVTKLIQGIAIKSQILAINAAIEASRAGEKGKGFMVITDEIKNMSEQTISATNNVRSHIEQIKARTQNAVNLASQGMSTVEDGANLSKSAQKRLNSIAESSEKFTESVHLTSEIAKSQANQTRHVVGLIEEISVISQQSNQCANETVNIGTQLNDKSNNIKSMLGQFRLN